MFYVPVPNTLPDTFSNGFSGAEVHGGCWRIGIWPELGGECCPTDDRSQVQKRRVPVEVDVGRLVASQSLFEVVFFFSIWCSHEITVNFTGLIV
jgi:hypothetical protein